MKPLTVKSMLHIIRRTLSLIDARLLEHGERVAYLVYAMLETQGGVSREELRTSCIVAVLHDIGAYKTEEIDDMIQFETANVWKHAIYGYLFVRGCSPLAQWADAILYHHLAYDRFPQVACQNERLAQRIHLADRADILTRLEREAVTPDFFVPYRDTMFRAADIDLLFQADRERAVFQKLRDGSFRAELLDLLDTMEMEQKGVLDYLRMLVYAVDFRSETTVAHTITTVSISMTLAARMGLSVEEAQRIYYGAMLHDIGKIAIPLSILDHPGRLCYEEMARMKTHVSITRDLIEGYVEPAICAIAARHHEKLDGSGYPSGLTGETLTRSERIVAVADIISALYGRRSYKQAYGKEKILAILTDMRDRGLLCPAVTSLAIESYDAIMAQAMDNCRAPLETYQNMLAEFDRLARSLQSVG